MPSAEYEKLAQNLKPGLADPADPVLEVRAKMERIHPTQVPADVKVERTTLGGVGSAWVSTPESEGSDRVLLHVHGGAFVSTTIVHYGLYAASLSRAAGARVVVFDYGLAPEHRFPQPIEETLAVYRALLEAGTPAGRIAFCGDSCGAGIALAALVRLRDAGDPLPAGFVSLTGWFDLEAGGDAARHPRGVDPFVDPEWIRRRGRDYVGPDGDPRDPLASPLHADLAGLPPMLLHAGGIDITRDDATRLAARAGAAGVSVTLEIWPEMIHGWHGLATLIPEGREALARAGEFVRRVTEGASGR